MTDTIAGSAKRTTGGCRSTDDGLDENYAALATAIIERAIREYDVVLEKLYAERDPRERIRQYKLKAGIEAFFRSDWYEVLTDLDPNYLLRRTREIATKRIKKKIHKRHSKDMKARNRGLFI